MLTIFSKQNNEYSQYNEYNKKINTICLNSTYKFMEKIIQQNKKKFHSKICISNDNYLPSYENKLMPVIYFLSITSFLIYFNRKSKNMFSYN
jgi:hypothetical protein